MQDIRRFFWSSDRTPQRIGEHQEVPMATNWTYPSTRARTALRRRRRIPRPIPRRRTPVPTTSNRAVATTPRLRVRSRRPATLPHPAALHRRRRILKNIWIITLSTDRGLRLAHPYTTVGARRIWHRQRVTRREVLQDSKAIIRPGESRELLDARFDWSGTRWFSSSPVKILFYRRTCAFALSDCRV